MNTKSVKIMDLHNHTLWSDGEDTMRSIIKNAVEKGVTTIGISDHFHTSKCDSVSISELNEYIGQLDKLKEEYKDRIEVLRGVEICLDRDWCDVETLPYKRLNRLDYVLLEYIDDCSSCIKLDELNNITKNFTCRVGLAHTNPFTLVELYDIDYVIKVLKENNIFWEINIALGYEYFDIIKNKINNDEVRNWFKKLKDNHIEITVGSDTHDLLDYDFNRLELANEFAMHKF